MIPVENSNLDRYSWAGEKLKKLLQGRKDRNAVYDIGSRDGILKKYVQDLDIDYKGFDLLPLEGSIREWNIEQPFPYADPKADVIVFLEVIEHLNNPWLSFANLGNVIKEDGYILLSTPNPAWSKSRLDFLMRGFLSCFTQSDLDDNHHVFTPWPHIVEKLLADNGFKIVEYYTLDGKTRLFSSPILSWKFPFIIINRLIKQIIERRDPAACGMSYALVAQKVKSSTDNRKV